MNTAVGDEVLEGNAGGLSTNRIEAREDNRLGRIVDHEIDTGNLLEGADIATLAADDATLEIVGRNVHRRHRDFGRMIGSAPLDSERENLLRLLVAFSTDLLLRLADNGRRLMRDLAANLIEQLTVGIIACELRDALKLIGLLCKEILELTRALLDLASLARELVLALIKRVIPAIEGLFALHHAILEDAKLLFTLLLFVLCGLTMLDDLFFGLEQGFLLEGFCLSLSITDKGLGFLVSGLDFRVRFPKAALLSGAHENDGGNDTDKGADDTEHDFHASPSFRSVQAKRRLGRDAAICTR